MKWTVPLGFIYVPFFRQEKGLAAVLVPGGALEALNSDEDKIRLVLNRRKGFIKLALRFGVNLVPTFSFGENFIYDQVKAEKGKELQKLHFYFLTFELNDLSVFFFQGATFATANIAINGDFHLI